MLIRCPVQMKNPERSCILQKSVKIVYYLNYYPVYKLYSRKAASAMYTVSSMMPTPSNSAWRKVCCRELSLNISKTRDECVFLFQKVLLPEQNLHSSVVFHKCAAFQFVWVIIQPFTCFKKLHKSLKLLYIFLT